MPGPWWWIPVALAVLAVVVLLLRRPMRSGARDARLSQARKGFHQQRERLEAKFIRLAAAHAGVDSPRWTDCDFDDGVWYVRNRSTRELSALVAVTVALESVGQPPASVGELIRRFRAGTAVFRFDRDHWETDGRVILNLSPSEAIRFYQSDLEMVGEELAGRPA
jgi:hypothetical protein